MTSLLESLCNDDEGNLWSMTTIRSIINQFAGGR